MSEQQGLGDKVEKFAKKVGADKLARTVEHITKRPCGCKKRKEWLNRLGERLSRK